VGAATPVAGSDGTGDSPGAPIIEGTWADAGAAARHPASNAARPAAFIRAVAIPSAIIVNRPASIAFFEFTKRLRDAQAPRSCLCITAR
jgi:hypothetical protein